MPEFIAPDFTFTSLVSIGLPFFLVTMASQNAPGFATMKASGYPLAVSPLIIVTGGLALLLSPLASSPSASRPLPPPFVKALMPTRIRLNAGWRPSQPVGFICWRGFRRLYYRDDGRTAAELDPDAGRAGAAWHHQREFISGPES
jgi:hypothetical protein